MARKPAKANPPKRVNGAKKAVAKVKKAPKTAKKAASGRGGVAGTLKKVAKKLTKAVKPAKKSAKTAKKAVKKAVKKLARKPAKKAPSKPIRKIRPEKASKSSAIINPRKGREAAAAGRQIALPKGYRPTVKEEFMNPLQIEYFRQKLLNWRLELLTEATDTLHNLSEENFQKPDMTDRAQIESDASLQLRTRDRERKLLSKIEAALRRIDEGTYGFCEETDEPISLKRLEARPIATLSLDAQERHERMERVHRDD